MINFLIPLKTIEILVKCQENLYTLYKICIIKYIFDFSFVDFMESIDNVCD